MVSWQPSACKAPPLQPPSSLLWFHQEVSWLTNYITRIPVLGGVRLSGIIGTCARVSLWSVKTVYELACGSACVGGASFPCFAFVLFVSLFFCGYYRYRDVVPIVSLLLYQFFLLLYFFFFFWNLLAFLLTNLLSDH